MPDKLKMMAWLGAKFTLKGQGCAISSLDMLDTDKTD